jgi:hypothetical protein
MAVRQVAERARALSDATCAHTQQLAGRLIGLRPHRLLLCSSVSKPGNTKAKKLQFLHTAPPSRESAAFCPSRQIL